MVLFDHDRDRFCTALVALQFGTLRQARSRWPEPSEDNGLNEAGWRCEWCDASIFTVRR
jgi:hypothetical protein